MSSTLMFAGSLGGIQKIRPIVIARGIPLCGDVDSIEGDGSACDRIGAAMMLNGVDFPIVGTDDAHDTHTLI